jgi:hypothetical protein
VGRSAGLYAVAKRETSAPARNRAPIVQSLGLYRLSYPGSSKPEAE